MRRKGEESVILRARKIQTGVTRGEEKGKVEGFNTHPKKVQNPTA